MVEPGGSVSTAVIFNCRACCGWTVWHVTTNMANYLYMISLHRYIWIVYVMSV